MKQLKEDISKLKTATNYAKEKGVNRRTVYNWRDEGKIETVEIDGILFVRIK